MKGKANSIMRRIAFSALAFGALLISVSAGAVPLTGTAQVAPATKQSAIEDVRYVTRCHTVMVKRWVGHHLERVPVRRCNRVWVR